MLSWFKLLDMMIPSYLKVPIEGLFLTGWTGNEVLYAFNILAIWDSQEAAIENKEVCKSSLPVTGKTKPQLTKTHLKPEYLKRKKEAEEKLEFHMKI